MNQKQTKEASEIMKRYSEGELIEADYGGVWRIIRDPNWNWYEAKFRVLDFPPPPPNSQYHNPHGLTATQVGVHNGWRLLLVGEGFPKDCEVFAFGSWAAVGLGWKRGVKTNEAWSTNWAPKDVFRTKAPLPELDPMEKALGDYRKDYVASGSSRTNPAPSQPNRSTSPSSSHP